MPVNKVEYQFQLGLTLLTMLTTESPNACDKPPHPWTWKPGAASFIQGNGFSYFDGYPQVTWTFDFLTYQAVQWIVTTILGGLASRQVFVRTKNNTDNYVSYTGILHGPVLGETMTRGVGGYFGVTLKFTHLVPAT